MLSRSKTPERSKFSATDTREKPVHLLYGTAQASTLTPEIILLT